MALAPSVGSVAALWRFPVKSMGGEELGEAELTSQGIFGDRAFAVMDVETGKIVSAKSVRLFPHVLDCKATFVESPRFGRPLPAVRIALPNGRAVNSDSPDADGTLSDFFQRHVTLARAEAAGIDSPVPVGTFFDAFPMSVLTTSTLARLAELAPQSRFDPRRFRMNVIVGTSTPGFPENEWIGREITVGDMVRLRLAKPDVRCAMTTLAQGELPHDADVLRTLVRHNSIHHGADGGLYPCAGVYAMVGNAGTVRRGDPVRLA
mgnify:CR=1 FL=1